MARRDVSLVLGTDDLVELVVPPFGTSYHEEEAGEAGAAGGYAYKDMSDRYILWRIHGRALELFEHFELKDLQGGSLLLSFGSMLVPNARLIEGDQDGAPALFLFVLSEDHTLYRFCFAHPSGSSIKVRAWIHHSCCF